MAESTIREEDVLTARLGKWNLQGRLGQPDAAAASLRRAAELAQPGDRRAADALAKLAPSGRP